MTGADAEHYRGITAETSRLVRFSDGVNRLIRLTNWEWEVFDRWPEITGWYRSLLPDQALQIARTVRDEDGSETFELDLRVALSCLLKQFMADCAFVRLEAANENL